MAVGTLPNTECNSERGDVHGQTSATAQHAVDCALYVRPQTAVAEQVLLDHDAPGHPDQDERCRRDHARPIATGGAVDVHRPGGLRSGQDTEGLVHPLQDPGLPRLVVLDVVASGNVRDVPLRRACDEPRSVAEPRVELRIAAGPPRVVWL